MVDYSRVVRNWISV